MQIFARRIEMNAQVNELQVIDQNEIALAFNNDQGIQAIIDSIKSQVNEKFEGVVWDFSKKKDRETVASLAYRVGRSKTAIDAEGKKLKEQYTVFTKKIDAERKLAREQLEAEQARIRKPLDEWEQAEKNRVAKHECFIAEIKKLANQENSSAQMIRDDIEFLTNEVAVDSSLEEFEQEAKIAKFETLEKLRTALVTREKYEAEQAELERLRKEQSEREQRERDERIAKEAADKARIEAEAKALAEKQRFEREQKEQAELAERQQREAAEREARLQAEKEAALLREEQLKQQAIEREKQAEIDRQKAIEQERLRIEREQVAKAEAELKEQQAREANKAHREKICGEALQGLLDLGVAEDQAKEILRAINKGKVPHVSLNF